MLNPGTDPNFIKSIGNAMEEALHLINREKKTDFTFALYFFKQQTSIQAYNTEEENLQIVILNDLSENFSAWDYAITVYPEDYITESTHPEIVFCVYTKKYNEVYFYNKPLMFDQTTSETYFDDRLILKDKQSNPFYLREPKKWWQWWRLIEKTH